MGAAPGAAFAVEVLEHHFVLGRELLEEPAVVDGHHVVLGSVAVEEPCGAHVTEGFVVAVAFAVGADAYELRFLAVCVPGVGDAAPERSRVAQEVFEPYGRRKPGVVEEYVEVAVTDGLAVLVARVHAVGACRVNIGVAASGPFFGTELAEFIGLRRREDGVLDSRLDELHDGFEVDCRFGKPHCLGHASKMELEIFDAPADLRALVAFARERHDDVVVDLCNRVAVPEPLEALLVGFLDAPVGIGRVRADPTHERRAHVETHEFVVVYDIYDTTIRIKDTACGIGAVTLAGDTVVPVVVGACAGLVLDDASPWIFTRRLVKMAVDGKIEGVLFAHV